VSADALYYPWIDPPSKVMLISCLLYWDHLYTIVPEGEDKPFKHSWTKAACNYGFLKPRIVSPYCYEVYKASEEFAEDLARPAITNGVAHVKRRRPGRDPQGYRIHPGKMSRRLLPENLGPPMRARIWNDPKPDEQGYLRMSREYALPYMSRLVSVVADTDRTTAFTHQRWGRDVVVDRFVDPEGSDPVGANEARLASVSFATIWFAHDVSLADVLRFRDTHSDALSRYRKAIHELAVRVTAADSANAGEREIQRIAKDEFKPAHDRLAAKLKEAGIDFTLAALQAAGGAFIGASFGGQIGAVAGGLVGLSFSAWKWRIARDRVLRDKPMTYLVELRKQFHVHANEGDR